MENRISGFQKTNHFLYRQWDRGVTDKLLNDVLDEISPTRKNILLVVSKNYLKRKGVNSKCELFIKIKKCKLITCFYCDFNCYFKRKIRQNYLILQ